MIPFKLFLERKKRNPLRKQELEASGQLDIASEKFINLVKNFYRTTDPDDIEDLNDKRIKLKYDNLMKSSSDLAENYLNSEITKYINNSKRNTSKQYKKIYEYMGVQVFLDEANVEDTNYAPSSYNYRMVKHSVLVMLVYIRDLLPNKKPKIVITSIKNHPYTKSAYDEESNPVGMAGDKFIFIDEHYVDQNALWVHEYAHWVVDLIPKQTQELLIKAFDKFVGIYYSNTKTKKKDAESLTDLERYKISQKLGFPEYGLTDHNEFFAVLIEFWKQLPNNKLTYKFKSLVKNILARL